MKKITLLGAFLFFFIINTHSQVLMTLIFGDKLNNGGVEFGLIGGGNFGTITDLESTNRYKDWNLGFYFNIRLKESPWFIHTGVLVKSSVGTDLSKNDVVKLGLDTFSLSGTYDQTITTFIVPVMLKYRFKNRIHLEAGTQFGLASKANVEFNYDDSQNTVIIRQENRDLIHRIDAGLSAGAGYRFNDKATGATISFRYYYGLVDVYKNIKGTKNSTFYLHIEVPIGASDCAQEKKREKAQKKAEKKALKEQNKK